METEALLNISRLRSIVHDTSGFCPVSDQEGLFDGLIDDQLTFHELIVNLLPALANSHRLGISPRFTSKTRSAVAKLASGSWSAVSIGWWFPIKTGQTLQNC